MRRLAAVSLHRPRMALFVWLLLAVVLAALGSGAKQHVQPTSLQVSGTESARAHALVEGHFDDATTVPVLLSGPSHDVRSQGRALAERLSREPGVTLVSPWNAPTQRRVLRPAANQLLLLASLSGSDRVVDAGAQRVRDLVAAQTRAPVRAHVTGLPLLSHALADSSNRAVRRAELVAIPALLLVLLLIFRTPLAAAIPVVLGVGTVIAASGLVSLLSETMPIDGLGTALASMMGLALAVDYSLLMVSRFREERRAGADVHEAAHASVVGTTHTIVAAGASIVLAMVLVALLAPGTPVVSAALGVGAAGVLAIVGAALALPAALLLAGSRLDRGPVAADHHHAAPGWFQRASRTAAGRPGRTLAAGCLVLALVAVPAFSVRTAGPDSRQLPPSSSARDDLDAVNAVAGPGWSAGFEMIAVARAGTMTTPARLRALTAFQRETAADPDVRAVLGPGTVAARAAKLRTAGRALLRQQRELANAIPKQTKTLTTLKGSVGKLEAGANDLRGAFSQADAATRTLNSGSDAMAGGVTQLRNGVQGAVSGARKLNGGLQGAASGAKELSAGASSAREGSVKLADAIHKIGGAVSLASPTARDVQNHLTGRRDAVTSAASAARSQNQSAIQSLTQAQAVLATVKPTVQTMAAASAIAKAKATLNASNVAASLDSAADGLTNDIQSTGKLADRLSGVSVHPLAAQARKLTAGLTTMRDNLRALSASVSAIAGTSGAVQTALARLGGGTATLAGGLDRLRAGVSGVTNGVQSSRKQSDQLVRGVSGAQGALAGLSPKTPNATHKAELEDTPSSIVNSGYFILAALDGRPGSGVGLNVDHGGQAARVLIVPRYAPGDPRTVALYRRLTASAHRFGAATGTDAAVGGPAALLMDYESDARGRFPIIVFALALATILLLAMLLRSLIVPLIGVGLTLLTVGATIGIMGQLFSNGLDTTTLTAVFAVMFALSIDYQVFIVGRIREELDRGTDASTAIASGLRSTAPVVAGAALSMIAVFVAFAITDVPSLRQFGGGLAIAIALDATIVRLVLLPAALQLAGRRAWWGERPLRTTPVVVPSSS